MWKLNINLWHGMLIMCVWSLYLGGQVSRLACVAPNGQVLFVRTLQTSLGTLFIGAQQVSSHVDTHSASPPLLEARNIFGIRFSV